MSAAAAAAAAATIGPFNTDTVSVSGLPATAKPLIHVDVAKVFPPSLLKRRLALTWKVNGAFIVHHPHIHNSVQVPIKVK